MNKYECEISTLLENLFAICSKCFKCLKRHTGKTGLWVYGLGAWTLFKMSINNPVKWKKALK